MGQLVDFTNRKLDKQGRAQVKSDIAALIENLNVISGMVDTMSDEGLTALCCTNDLTTMSRMLQMLMMNKLEGQDISHDYAVEVFQTFMDTQMALGYFYADRLGIDTKTEAFRRHSNADKGTE